MTRPAAAATSDLLRSRPVREASAAARRWLTALLASGERASGVLPDAGNLRRPESTDATRNGRGSPRRAR